VTNDLTSLIERARQSAATGIDAATGTTNTAAGNSADRQKLLHIAQEFESMLLLQVLRDMRRAGRWDSDDEGEEKSGLGAETLFDTVDVELSSHLAKVQGFGLSKQLLEAFDRMQGVAAGGPQPPAPPSMPDIPPAVAAIIEQRMRDARAVPQQPTYAMAPTHTADGADTAGTGLTDDSVGSPTVPTVNGHVTSDFGWRRDPFTGQSRFHRGVDLAAVYGQDVQAARAGRVVFSGVQGGYGNTVVLEHADGTRSRYAHLSALLVTAGTDVGTGAPVGRAGHSGRATGTHVHFEITGPDGRPMAPDRWARGGEEI
jgi:murein DD-endopeptidase MepM/ murein hydrolase activator NlpD